MRPQRARTACAAVGLALVSRPVIAGLGFVLLAMTPTAVAIDPGRAQGYFAVNGERIELSEAFAHLHSDREGRLPFTPELRIVLADRPVPQRSLAGLESLGVLDLARAGKVRGRHPTGRAGSHRGNTGPRPRACSRTCAFRRNASAAT
jgi:hypothetical protein